MAHISNEVSVNFNVSLSWWVKPYIHVLAFFCNLHDCEPDYDKVTRTIMKGVKIKVAL